MTEQSADIDTDTPPDVRSTSVEIEPAAEAVDGVDAASEPAPDRLPERRAASGGLDRPIAKAQTPHAARFQFATGALVMLAVLATAVAFLLLRDGSANVSTSTWSAFKPSSNGQDTGAQEIADHVGAEYKLPSGRQIVAVTGGPLAIQDLPMRIAIRQPAADGGKIDILDGGGVLYRLCGLGPKCTITEGKPSPERHLLLRREALELALYSFRYLRNTDNVVVFMPSGTKKTDPTEALHFRRGDVKPELVRPLQATLPAPVPNPINVVRSADAPFIDAFTRANLFSFSLTQSNQDASVFLVLDPIASKAVVSPAPALLAPGVTTSSPG